MRKKILWDIYDEILSIILSFLYLVYKIVSLIYPKWFYNKFMQRTCKWFNRFTGWLASKYKFEGHNYE